MKGRDSSPVKADLGMLTTPSSHGRRPVIGTTAAPSLPCLFVPVEVPTPLLGEKPRRLALGAARAQRQRSARTGPALLLLTPTYSPARGRHPAIGMSHLPAGTEREPDAAQSQGIPPSPHVRNPTLKISDAQEPCGIQPGCCTRRNEGGTHPAMPDRHERKRDRHLRTADPAAIVDFVKRRSPRQIRFPCHADRTASSCRFG